MKGFGEAAALDDGDPREGDRACQRPEHGQCVNNAKCTFTSLSLTRQQPWSVVIFGGKFGMLIENAARWHCVKYF